MKGSAPGVPEPPVITTSGAAATMCSACAVTEVSARAIALVGQDLYAGGIRGLFQAVINQIAPAVAVADIADRLDAGLLSSA